MSRPVTSELIARAGASLAEGGWRYTRRQLYYATCAAAETAPRSPARSQFALGVLLGLITLILLPVRPAALAFGGLAALAIALGLVSLLTRRPPAGRALAVSFPEFEALLASDTAPAGMIELGEATADPAGPDGPVLVCDTEQNALSVAANLATAQLAALAVTTRTDGYATGATVIAVHDASPRGCALAPELSESGYRVIDAGLRPAWIDANRVQVLEGAVARMPRDLSEALTEGELDWLRSGRRVELAVLPPDRLMALVREAIERASTATGLAAGPLTAEPAPLGGQLFGVA